MEHDLAHVIAENPLWQLVLQAYAAEEAATAERIAIERAAARKTTAKAPVSPPKEIAPPADAAGAAGDSESEESQRKLTWVRRLTSVVGVPAGRLAPIHGRLIADGLLQFLLGNRDEGVLYRLTSEARQALESLPVLVPATSSGDDASGGDSPSFPQAA